MHWTIHIRGGPRRVNHAAVEVNGTIYSFGGYCTDENYTVQRPIDIHVLDPTFYRWKLLPSRSEAESGGVVPFQRYGHTVVPFGKYVYLWGGRNDEVACSKLYRFDTQTLKWESPPVSGTVPGARDGHTAVVIRNQMLICGGYEEETRLFSQNIYTLNLRTLKWTYFPAAGTPPSYRDFHTATVYLDRYMFIFGGRGDTHGPFHTRSEKYCNTLVYFDIERQEWSRPAVHGSPPEGRRSHSAFMHNGYMYIFGGYNGITDRHYSDLFQYNPETYTWTELKPFGKGPTPRRRQGCIVIDHRVFFFGGTSPNDTHVVNLDFHGEENALIDRDDLYVLEMKPSLRTLCLLKIIENLNRLDITILPNELRQEIKWSTTQNKLLPIGSASG